MASLNSLYIKVETLETLLKTLKSKGEKGLNLTISLSDEANQYGQNVSGFVAQSKEERESGKQKFYVGNGNTFWTKGETPICKKTESAPPIDATPINDNPDDLPF